MASRGKWYTLLLFYYFCTGHHNQNLRGISRSYRNVIKVLRDNQVEHFLCRIKTTVILLQKHIFHNISLLLPSITKNLNHWRHRHLILHFKIRALTSYETRNILLWLKASYKHLSHNFSYYTVTLVSIKFLKCERLLLYDRDQIELS